MQHNRFFPIFLLSLLSLALAAPAHGAAAQGKAQSPSADKAGPAEEKDPYVERFKELDRDGDGHVSRTEWPLAPESFDVVDRNKDGRLSRHELLSPNVMRRERLDGQFRNLDTNRDGRLSAAEWQRGGAGYGRLDVDNDGQITRREYADQARRIESTWRPSATIQDRRSFQNLDRNRDNHLSLTEWTGSAALFDRADRNKDGTISPNEWPQR